jgi:hypothetical protein
MGDLETEAQQTREPIRMNRPPRTYREAFEWLLTELERIQLELKYENDWRYKLTQLARKMAENIELAENVERHKHKQK